MRASELDWSLEDRDRIARIQIEAWKGFRESITGLQPQEGYELDDGEVELRYCSDPFVRMDVPEGPPDPLTTEEIAYLDMALAALEEQAVYAQACILDYYHEQRPEFEDFLPPDEYALAMPMVHSVEGLKPLLHLYSMTINPRHYDGEQYVSYVFYTSWEREHGLGVLMLGNHCVSIGGYDEAFNLPFPDENDTERAD